MTVRLCVLILVQVAVPALLSQVAGAETVQTEERPLQPLPEKLVVLTFDDAVRSHLTVAAPILEKHGFGATFFVCNAWMNDEANFLSWPEVAELHRRGFEIGNHTWNHVALHEEDAAAKTREETRLVEEALEKVGVPRCVSFSWPGSHFGPEALGELRCLGYCFGRRGSQPIDAEESASGASLLYDPARHDPLLIPTTGIAGPEWSLDAFRATVDHASKGKIVVLVFHGVPDGAHPGCSTPPERFEAFMNYLADNQFTVIACRDLQRYFRLAPKPEDPLSTQRFFR